jgi:hypothetical protein
MTAVLLALLVAQPAPDETVPVVRNLAARLSKALTASEKDPDEAIRLLTAMIDDPKARELEARSPAVRAYREQALYTRARLHLRQGGAQAVTDDMTALLDRHRALFGSRIASLVAHWLRRRPKPASLMPSAAGLLHP